MSDCKCPLKLAAIDAPSSIAIIEKGNTLTYQELNALAETFRFTEGEIVMINSTPTPRTIATLFAAWRQNASVFAVNPKLPLIQRPKKQVFQSLLLMTSGTTGTPKIAVLSLKSLLINAMNSLSLEKNDKWLLSLPLYHVSGIGIMLRCICAKAPLVFDPSHPEITHISSVPTQLYRQSPIYKNLKCILLGGGPLPYPPPSLPIYGTYGLTEMGSMVLIKKHPLHINGNLYLGSPLPKRELKIDKEGEIWVRGETLFEGYLDETPQSGAWFRTGDIGIIDPQHGIAITGRKDFQFISGGENIQPEEIEKYLTLFPGVMEAIVLPQEDPEYGALPVAFVRTEGNLSLKKVHAFLENYLPKYKFPIAIFTVDSFPKKGFKIDRHELKKRFNLSLEL